jgi:hypothetical protein
MATRNESDKNGSTIASTDALQRLSDVSRTYLEIAFRGYSAIAVRKHGFVMPAELDNLASLSLSELERLVTLVRDLAHLPPG